jgi:drug/metabolite transporter (DMT)-like permease
MNTNHLGSVYLALAASIWGGMYVVSKVVLAVIPPLELVWLRYIVALFALVLISTITRQSWKIKKQDIPLIILIGIVGYFISIWAQFLGTKLSSAQMGSVITSTTPTFMIIFAHFLLKEKITPVKALSVCLATIGVLLIAKGNSVNSPWLGTAILVISALAWALMSVLIKLVPQKYPQLVVTTYAMLVATVIMTPFVVPEIRFEHFSLLLNPVISSGIFYLGVVSTAFAFFLWNKGMQMVQAGKGGLYFFFQPLVGTLLGWLLLGEQITTTFWIGALLILGGVLAVIKD